MSQPSSNSFAFQAPATTPQPAVVVGLGAFGEQIRKELQQRHDLYRAFQSPLEAAYAKLVRVVNLPDATLWDEPAMEVRQKFLAAHLRDTVRTIRSEFDRVRYHAEHRLVDNIRPVVYVVGATWEPAGAALLWPLASIIRNALGDQGDYALSGVFVAADYRSTSDDREHSDAHTFTVLSEGDLLGNGALPWQGTIDQLFPQRSQSNRGLYDHIYLIDSLKANNSTIQFLDNEYEVAVETAIFLEGLIFTSLSQIVDHTLLDDYRSKQGQSYIGIGVSTLVVPLREIHQAVERYSIGSLVQQRLLTRPAISPPIRGHVAPLLASAQRQIIDNTRSSCERSCADFGRDGLALSGGGRLLIEFAYENESSETMVIRGLDIRGDDPTAHSQNLRADVVLDRLSEERVNSLRNVVGTMRDGLDQERDQTVASVDQLCGQLISTLLRSGDDGLRQAIEVSEMLVAEFNRQAREIEQRLKQHEGTVRRLQEGLRDEARWYDERKILRPALEWRPRTVAVIVRGFMLFCLLYLFYWDGIIRGTVFYPFGNLGMFATATLANRSEWEQTLALAVLIPILLLVVVLAGLPALAVRQGFRRHRQRLAHDLLADLQQVVQENYCTTMREVAARIHDVHLPQLCGIRDELQKESARMLSGKLDQAADDYIEHAVVSPQAVVEPYQQRAAERVLKQQGQRLIDSWQHPDPSSPWAIRSATDVIATLHAQVKPAVEEIVTRPVNEYLQPSDHDDWFYQLWMSSVPWVKVSIPASSDEEMLELNVLALRGGSQTTFASTARIRTDFCRFLDWSDPFRILLVRMICGVNAVRLARWTELQHAFQLQPQSTQRQISDNPSLLATYRSIVAEPPSAPKQESVSDNRDGDRVPVDPTPTDRRNGDSIEPKGQDRDEVEPRKQDQDEVEPRKQDQDEVEPRKQDRDEVEPRKQDQDEVELRRQDQDEVEPRKQDQDEVELRRQGQDEVEPRKQGQDEVGVDISDRDDIELDNQNGDSAVPKGSDSIEREIRRPDIDDQLTNGNSPQAPKLSPERPLSASYDDGEAAAGSNTPISETMLIQSPAAAQEPSDSSPRAEVAGDRELDLDNLFAQIETDFTTVAQHRTSEATPPASDYVDDTPVVANEDTLPVPGSVDGESEILLSDLPVPSGESSAELDQPTLPDMAEVLASMPDAFDLPDQPTSSADAGAEVLASTPDAFDLPDQPVSSADAGAEVLASTPDAFDLPDQPASSADAGEELSLANVALNSTPTANLRSALAAFDVAITGLDLKTLTDFRLALLPLRQYTIHQTDDSLDPVELITALSELDKELGQVDTSSRQILTTPYALLDNLLAQIGVEPVVPRRGEEYNAQEHAIALFLQPDPSSQPVHIMRCVQRGYRASSSHQMIAKPRVIVGTSLTDGEE